MEGVLLVLMALCWLSGGGCYKEDKLSELFGFLFFMWFPTHSYCVAIGFDASTKAELDAHTLPLNLQNCELNKPLFLIKLYSFRYFWYHNRKQANIPSKNGLSTGSLCTIFFFFNNNLELSVLSLLTGTLSLPSPLMSNAGVTSSLHITGSEMWPVGLRNCISKLV